MIVLVDQNIYFKTALPYTVVMQIELRFPICYKIGQPPVLRI